MRSKASFVATVSVVVFVATSLWSSTQASDLTCAETHDSSPTETFELSVKVADRVYKHGDVARFRVKVTRTVHGINVGPAKGAWVVLGLAIDDVYLADGARTDRQGQAVVKVLIKGYTPEGSADVKVFAQKRNFDIPCESEYEYEFGRLELLNYLSVAR